MRSKVESRLFQDETLCRRVDDPCALGVFVRELVGVEGDARRHRGVE